MDCVKLAEEIAALRKKLIKLNALDEALRREIPNTDPDTLLDELQRQTGMDRKDLEFILERSESVPEQAAELGAHSEKIFNEARTTIEELGQKKEGDPPNPGKIKSMMEAVRKRFADGIERAISIRPKGASDALNAGLDKLATEKDVFEISPGVFCGTAQETFLRADSREVYKDIASTNRSFMKEEHMLEAIGALGNMRGKNVPQYISELRKRIDTIESSQHEDKFNPVIKEGRRLLDLAEQAYQEPKIRDYLQKQFNSLDAAQEYGVKHGFLEGGKKDFFHNIVAIKDHADLVEDFLYKKKFDISSFRDTKKYENGWETMLQAGVMPVTFDSNVVLAHYWKAFGNASRKSRFADRVREQALLGDKSTWTIEDNKKQLPAFVSSDKLGEDTKFYKPLDIIGPAFKGLYGHSEVYKWANALFASPRPSGFVEAAMKGNGMWKCVNLSFGMYHLKSLYSKGMTAAAATGGSTIGGVPVWGVKSFYKIFTAQGIGAEALRSSSENHSLVVEAISKGGLSFHLNDGLYRGLDREFSMKTGDKTIKTKFWDAIDKATGWQHKLLFETVHPQLKAGLYVQAVKSEWFGELVKKNGGNREKAIKQVCSMLNDSLGARNLELAGRSPLTQRFLQAALLAPDWQESKIRRIFGAALYEDPIQRKMLQGMLFGHMAMIVVTRMGLQALADETTGNTRTMEEQAQDIINGKFGSIWLGKIKDSKGREKDHFANVFGSEQQDARMLATPFKAAWLAVSEGAPGEFPKEIMREYATKASPMIKGAIDYAIPQYGEDKDEFRFGDPKTWNTPFAPIAVQQAIKATHEAKPDEKAQKALIALGTGFTGTPLETKSIKKKKKDKEKRLAILR